MTKRAITLDSHFCNLSLQYLWFLCLKAVQIKRNTLADYFKSRFSNSLQYENKLNKRLGLTESFIYVDSQWDFHRKMLKNCFVLINSNIQYENFLISSKFLPFHTIIFRLLFAQILSVYSKWLLYWCFYSIFSEN